MKTKTLKYIAGFSIVAIAILALSMPKAFARNNENDDEDNRDSNRQEQMMRVDHNDNQGEDIRFGQNDEGGMIRPDGEFKVGGVTVNSINASANMINVSFYGFSKDVNIAGAEISARNGSRISIADIKAGDKLIASGKYNKATRTISVEEIKDISYIASGVRNDEIQTKIQKLLEIVRQLQEQLNALPH